MIQDSKFVHSVNSNAPKKGWKITWHDDKKDNIFDESWLPILDQAQKEKRMISFQKEKNNAGYWNIMRLNLAEAQPPTQPQETAREQAVVQQAHEQHHGPATLTREQSIARMNGLTNATNLIVSGLFPAGEVGGVACQFEQYNLGIIDATQLDKNLSVYLKG